MLIISYDAVGDSEFERLMEYPAFSAFSGQAAAVRDIPTLCPSNTYPIHTSVATGVMPDIHGIISNTEPFPMLHPEWNAREAGIRVKTLWQAAAERGMDTAAVFWPVTAYSETIRYNIPEILPRPGRSQLIASLSAGSKLLQARMLLRHGKLLSGIDQPNRDDFAVACMADIIREYKPGLALMHLTAYDALCHKNGRGSDALKVALESLDRSLATLLDAAGDRDVLIFSDHSQINIQTVFDPNEILIEAGLLRRVKDEYIPGGSGCFFECCGGTAFFHAGVLPGGEVDKMRASVEQSEGFRRFLTQDEMLVSGYGSVAFGFSAKAGHCYIPLRPGHKAEHGYPADMPDYNVFYLARGYGLPPGSVARGGSLLDIAPLVAKRLGLDL